MMSPYQFNRLSHRERLQASLGGFGLTPGAGMVEMKAASGAIMKAVTVAAPSVLKANIGVTLTAPTINSGIAVSKVGQYATTPAQTFLNLKTGTGANPPAWTRGSQSQVNLQPAVAQVVGMNKAVPASDAPTPADTISKGVATMALNLPPLKNTFLEPPRFLEQPRISQNAFVPRDPAPAPAPTFVMKPRTPVEPPPVSNPVKNAVDKLIAPPTGTTNTGSGFDPGYDISEAKLPPGYPTTSTAAPQAPAAFSPNPLLIVGGVLALGAVVYLATR